MYVVTVDWDPKLATDSGVQFLFEELYEVTDFIGKVQKYSNHTYLIEFIEKKEG